MKQGSLLVGEYIIYCSNPQKNMDKEYRIVYGYHPILKELIVEAWFGRRGKNLSHHRKGEVTVDNDHDISRIVTIGSKLLHDKMRKRGDTQYAFPEGKEISSMEMIRQVTNNVKKEMKNKPEVNNQPVIRTEVSF